MASTEPLVALPFDCPPGFPAFLRRVGARCQKRKGWPGSSLFVEPWVAEVVGVFRIMPDTARHFYRAAVMKAVDDLEFRAALLTVVEHAGKDHGPVGRFIAAHASVELQIVKEHEGAQLARALAANARLRPPGKET